MDRVCVSATARCNVAEKNAASTVLIFASCISYSMLTLAAPLTSSRGIHFVDFLSVCRGRTDTPLYFGQIPPKLIRGRKVFITTKSTEEVQYENKDI